MYPVKLGYAGAVHRVNGLIANGHHAEAFVTAVFTAEKTLRRTLRQIIVSAGFRSIIADKIIRRLGGIHAISEAWELYDPCNRKLTALISRDDWQVIQRAAEMRNKLVHGTLVFPLIYCQQQACAVLGALNNVKSNLDAEYGFSGWTSWDSRKKAQLHVDPKVKWTPVTLPA